MQTEHFMPANHQYTCADYKGQFSAASGGAEKCLPWKVERDLECDLHTAVTSLLAFPQRPRCNHVGGGPKLSCQCPQPSLLHDVPAAVWVRKRGIEDHQVRLARANDLTPQRRLHETGLRQRGHLACLQHFLCQFCPPQPKELQAQVSASYDFPLGTTQTSGLP